MIPPIVTPRTPRNIIHFPPRRPAAPAISRVLGSPREFLPEGLDATAATVCNFSVVRTVI
jgi:hypothetical protein